MIRAAMESDVEIVNVFHREGTGCIASVKLNGRVKVGDELCQQGYSWTITGVEMRNPPRLGDEVGLVLRKNEGGTWPIAGEAYVENIL